MATNTHRYCVFCDKEVEPPPEGKTVAGRENSDEQVFVHHKGGCGRQLTESQTYTMGDADLDDR